MPVQINEVVIRATVSSQSSATNSSTSGDCNNNSSGGGGAGGDSVNEIVEKVLEILKIKHER